MKKLLKSTLLGALVIVCAVASLSMIVESLTFNLWPHSVVSYETDLEAANASHEYVINAMIVMIISLIGIILLSDIIKTAIGTTYQEVKQMLTGTYDWQSEAEN